MCAGACWTKGGNTFVLRANRNKPQHGTDTTQELCRWWCTDTSLVSFWEEKSCSAFNKYSSLFLLWKWVLTEVSARILQHIKLFHCLVTPHNGIIVSSFACRWRIYHRTLTAGFVFVLCKWLLMVRLTSKTKLLTLFDFKEVFPLPSFVAFTHLRRLQKKHYNYILQASLYIMTCLLFICTSLQRHCNSSDNCHIFKFNTEGNFDLENPTWQWFPWKSQMITEAKPSFFANLGMRRILTCCLTTQKPNPVKYRHLEFPKKTISADLLWFLLSFCSALILKHTFTMIQPIGSHFSEVSTLQKSVKRLWFFFFSL